MPSRIPPSTRPILVVQRRWPQQENPALPLLPADAPAVLGGRVTSVSSPLPVDAASLVARLDPRDLELPEAAVLRGVVEHATRAAGDVTGSVTLVAADVGTSVLVYALLTPGDDTARGRPADHPSAPRSRWRTRRRGRSVLVHEKGGGPSLVCTSDA